MTDLYLIAHKVRGEPAFDVATRMRCPLCDGVGGYMVKDFETGEVTDYEGPSCHECDGLGYWWIIPTSGHRAYPWWSTEVYFNEHGLHMKQDTWDKSVHYIIPPMPDTCPDHYPHSTTPTTSLTERLGIGKAPTKPIDRRI